MEKKVCVCVCLLNLSDVMFLCQQESGELLEKAHIRTWGRADTVNLLTLNKTHSFTYREHILDPPF